MPARPAGAKSGTTWFSRRHLLESLHQLAASYDHSTLNIYFGCNVLDVYWPRPGMQRDSAVLGVVNHNGEYTFWAPNCLLGADGVGSTVARTLRRAYPGEGFEMRKCTSDSAGLAFKVRTGLHYNLQSLRFCWCALQRMHTAASNGTLLPCCS